MRVKVTELGKPLEGFQYVGDAEELIQWLIQFAPRHDPQKFLERIHRDKEDPSLTLPLFILAKDGNLWIYSKELPERYESN